MKNFLIFLFTFIGALYQMKAQEFVPGELIIKINDQYAKSLKPNLSTHQLGIVALDELNQVHGIHSLKTIGDYRKTQTFLIAVEATADVENLLRIYNENPAIAYAEVNHIGYGSSQKEGLSVLEQTPNDQFYSRQWGFNNNGTFTVPGGYQPMSVTAGADASMELAWDIETGDPNIIIAVSDSGINMSHNDISTRIWSNPLEPIDGIDNDGNGLIDDYRGWNWIAGTNDPTDDNGHGTNIAGIIGAIANNTSGYAGANWNSKIMALKVLNSEGSGTYADMAASLYYAVDHDAKIVSMSIGGSSASQALKDAIAYMHEHETLLVACMMNFNNAVSYYPARYSLEYDNVIAVGSTDADDTRSNPFFWDANSGSNYGTHINVVAPGNYIYGLGLTNASYGTFWGGTSQATPLVSAIASLIWSVNPELLPSEVRQIIMDTAQDEVGDPLEDTEGFDNYYGWGRVNAHLALLAAQETLGIKEVAVASDQIRVMNPVKNKKAEIISGLDKNGKAAVSLISMEGNQLKSYEMNIQNGLNHLSLEGIPAGVYFLKLQLDNYTKIFKLIVE